MISWRPPDLCRDHLLVCVSRRIVRCRPGRRRRRCGSNAGRRYAAASPAHNRVIECEQLKVLAKSGKFAVGEQIWTRWIGRWSGGAHCSLVSRPSGLWMSKYQRRMTLHVIALIYATQAPTMHIAVFNQWAGVPRRLTGTAKDVRPG